MCMSCTVFLPTEAPSKNTHTPLKQINASSFPSIDSHVHIVLYRVMKRKIFLFLWFSSNKSKPLLREQKFCWFYFNLWCYTDEKFISPSLCHLLTLHSPWKCGGRFEHEIWLMFCFVCFSYRWRMERQGGRWKKKGGDVERAWSKTNRLGGGKWEHTTGESMTRSKERRDELQHFQSSQPSSFIHHEADMNVCTKLSLFIFKGLAVKPCVERCSDNAILRVWETDGQTDRRLQQY